MTPTRHLPAGWPALVLALAATAATAQTTRYDYDAVGRAIARTDGLGQRSTAAWDVLDRVTAQTNALGETTRFAYDGNDALVEATAANGAATAYTVDGLGRVRAEASPDRGVLDYTYDAAGNVVSVKDARGVRIETTYDALNRPLTRSFRTAAGAVEATHSYGWDNAANGIGRLSAVTTGAVTLSYAYDSAGRVAGKTQQIDRMTVRVAYEHEARTDRLAAIVYPSGRRLAFEYDAAGRVRALDWAGTPIATAIEWHPFGGVARMTLANGLVHERELDTAGRLAGYSLGGEFIELGYDAAGRLTERYHPIDPAQDQQFDYDGADRLTAYQGGAAHLAYTYDANGNRLAATAGAASTAYAYAPESNRLTQLGAAAIQSDAAGNRTRDAAQQYRYDAAGRLVAVSKGAFAPTDTVHYRHNGLGERAVKFGLLGFAHYLYDEAGHLIGEYDLQGRPLREYAWLGDLPVAVLDYPTVRAGRTAWLFGVPVAQLWTPVAGGVPAVYAIETDQLGTPRLLTDQTGAARWRWHAAPFGDSAADENPAGRGPLVFNLRFPGQYYDAESGLHYNYFRDYDPKTGRYLESDPIGLAGGVNTYTYVHGNPVSSFDPFGLVEYQNLGLIVGHLSWLARIQNDDFWKSPDFAPERRMLERLRKGLETPYDIGFYHHEMAEALECLKLRDLPADEALKRQWEVHRHVEEVQGNTKFERYHPSTRGDSF